MPGLRAETHPTAHSAGQASPSSPNTRSTPAFPSGRELFSPYPYSTTSRPGDDDSPRNPDRPVKLRSLEDVCASTDSTEESSDAKVPRRLGFQSPREAKSSGADFHSPASLPLAVKKKKTLHLLDTIKRSLFISLSLARVCSRARSFTVFSVFSNDQIKDTVLADQEMVTVEDQTSLGTGSGGPMGSQPGSSGPSSPKEPMGPNPGPQASGSPSGSPEKSENVQVLQSHEGQGGSDDPVPMGPDPGPGSPSESSEKPVILSLLAHEGR